ncbi:hypothetical protein [Kordiimonas sp.]|uniref:hypothetical protein n=1 Tax=Kordiimonas sp. TaxID=1970157 RepID=UPI003A93861C
MRLAIVVAACGLVLAAPMVAPTALMNKAEAQPVTARVSLEAEILAAAGNATALQAIINREQAAGRSAALAAAMGNASVALAATDVAGATALVLQAVSIAQSIGDQAAEEEVGRAASTVASTAMAGNQPQLAANISTQVAIGRSTNVAMGFVNAGGTAGTNVGSATQAQGQMTGVTTPVVRRTSTRRTVIPPRPRVPTTPVVPIIIEPNPDQAGSPT